MGTGQNIVVNVLEFAALLFLGVIMVIVFMHLLNGTLGSWMTAKFHSKAVVAT
jgi:hypothetical protein